MAITKSSSEHWVRMDEWSLVQAALLLNNIDPFSLSQDILDSLAICFENDGQDISRTNVDALGEENILQLERTYSIFRRIEFGIKYSNGSYCSLGAAMYRRSYHPYLIIYEANIRSLPIPKTLAKLIDRRFLRETGISIFTISSDFLTGNAPISANKTIQDPQSDESKESGDLKISKKVRNKYKAIGVLAHMFAEQTGEHWNGDKINAKKIKDDMLVWAGNHGIDEFGLKSIERDISESIKYIDKQVTLST